MAEGVLADHVNMLVARTYSARTYSARTYNVKMRVPNLGRMADLVKMADLFLVIHIIFVKTAIYKAQN